MSPLLLQPPSLSEALGQITAALRSAGIPNATLESLVLLEHVLGQPRTWLMAHGEVLLDAQQRERLDRLVERRRLGEPLAYLVQRREFFGLDLYVDRRVLIPRPETELLVERAITMVRKRGGEPTIVDVGTGSGAIALALARHLPGARIVAVDRSSSALEVARLNAMRLGLGTAVQFVQGDLLSWLRQPVDVIVANLPYIPADRLSTLPADVRDFEPPIALNGGVHGLELMQKLIGQSADRLADEGVLLLECDPEQLAPLTDATSRALPGCRSRSIRDGFGHQRVLEVRRS